MKTKLTTYELMINGDPTKTEIITQRTRPSRRGRVVVDSWLAADEPPASGTAADWDAYRARLGYAARV